MTAGVPTADYIKKILASCRTYEQAETTKEWLAELYRNGVIDWFEYKDLNIELGQKTYIEET